MYPNGDIYKGMFIRDERHGPGMILYKDGTFYKGNWQNDQYQGRGILKITTHKGSTVVEGSFDSGRFVGGICKAQY